MAKQRAKRALPKWASEKNVTPTTSIIRTKGWITPINRVEETKQKVTRPKPWQPDDVLILKKK